MRPFRFLFRATMTLSAMALIAAAGPAREATAQASPAPPTEAVSSLGWQLVARSGHGNAVVSPASGWQALAMTL